VVVLHGGPVEIHSLLPTCYSGYMTSKPGRHSLHVFVTNLEKELQKSGSCEIASTGPSKDSSISRTVVFARPIWAQKMLFRYSSFGHDNSWDVKDGRAKKVILFFLYAPRIHEGLILLFGGHYKTTINILVALQNDHKYYGRFAKRP
jgi:hypothetical protein